MEKDLGKPNGPAAAALLSAGIGCFVIGLDIVLAVISASTSNAMNWWNPAGPLVGKTGIGVIAWLVSWGILHLILRTKHFHLRAVAITSLVLVALGFLGSFPPFFDIFE